MSRTALLCLATRLAGVALEFPVHPPVQTNSFRCSLHFCRAARIYCRSSINREASIRTQISINPAIRGMKREITEFPFVSILLLRDRARERFATAESLPCIPVGGRRPRDPIIVPELCVIGQRTPVVRQAILPYRAAIPPRKIPHDAAAAAAATAAQRRHCINIRDVSSIYQLWP